MILEPKPPAARALAPVAVVRSGDLERAGRAWGRRTMSVVPGPGVALLATDPPLAPQTAFDLADRLASHVPTVPVQAGALFDDADAARRFVRAGATRFDELLEVAQHHEEWSISLRYAGHPAEPSGDETGDAGYLGRRRRENAQRDGIPPWALADLERCSAALGPIVEQTRWLAGTEGDASIALLVARGTDDRVERTFRSFASGLASMSVLSGPYPIYSFCTLA
ncbi:MAG: GvpL/GvpF family gas vesicle protein [Planctomycetota bacterium]